jgi:hypothetical protein
MESPRELLDDQPTEPFPVIARIERHALPAFVWWVGGGLVLSFMTFVAQETMYLLALWSMLGFAVALTLLVIAAYRVYTELLQLYTDVQEMLHSIAQATQPHAIAQDTQRLQTQPVSSSIVYDRDGVAIQFSEIFKEMS